MNNIFVGADKIIVNTIATTTSGIPSAGLNGEYGQVALNYDVTNLINVTGSLQSEINSLILTSTIQGNEINDLQQQIINVSGGLYSLIQSTSGQGTGSGTQSVSGYTNSVTLASLTGSLQTQINTVSGSVLSHNTTLSQLTSITGNYVNTVTLNSLTGSLQTQINSITANPPISLQKTYTQNSHGFSVGQVLRWNSGGGVWSLAQSNLASTSEALGIINSITPNTFNLVFSGEATFPGMTFTPGNVYFLSDTSAGAITTTEPTATGSISKPIFFAETINTGFVYNMRGQYISQVSFVDTISNQNISGSKTFINPVVFSSGISKSSHIVNTTPYNVVDNDCILLVDTTSSNITINLPINPLNGRELKIKKLYASNVLIVNPNSRAIESISQNLSASLASYSWLINYSTDFNSWFIY